MQRTRCACGAILDEAIDWCPQCYQPRSGNTPGGTSSGTPGGTPGGTAPGRTTPLGRTPVGREPAGAAAPLRRKASELRRWEASAVTFGLPGRLIATVLLVLPLALFLVTGSITGVVIYGLLYLRALRDIWRRAGR